MTDVNRESQQQALPTSKRRLAFNINDCVYVKLTDTGRAIHRAFWEPFHTERYPYKPPETDADGWAKFQAWDLMRVFGEHMQMGAPNPFQTSIQIELPAETILKFANVSCSQCGRDFGPGNHGYSHCSDHSDVKPVTGAKP